MLVWGVDGRVSHVLVYLEQDLGNYCEKKKKAWKSPGSNLWYGASTLLCENSFPCTIVVPR